MNIINRFTLRTLRQNKIRTLVTIIGIALSMAMFTGVTSLIVSFQQYLVQLEIADSGMWQGRLDNVPAEVVKNMQSDSEITGMNVVQNLGAALDEKSLDEEAPFLFLTGIDNEFTDYSAIQLLEGRLPKDSTEIVVSQNWLNTHEQDCQMGDTLTLTYGKRQVELVEPKVENWEIAGYSEEETLENSSTRQFQIVGICQMPSYQLYMGVLPGNIAFTYVENDADAVSAEAQSTLKAVDYTVLMRVKHPADLIELLTKYQKQCKSAGVYSAYFTHGSLLRYEGNSTNDEFNSVLYGMAAILIGIIMLGSISLIYNTFSISVSERTKQFGLLKSIGATKRQIRNSVFFEVLVLSLLGIPVGLLAGLGGIAVTLRVVAKILEPMLTIQNAVTLHLVVTPASVWIAILVSFVTVLLSAWLPARKAVKSPVMQSLRQSNDIRIKGRRLRANPLVYRFFGFEGMLATKNYKRNRRKYRATVLSLFMSIVLFVTAASFCMYMQNSVTSFSGQADYDVYCGVTDEDRGKKDLGTLKEEIGQVEGVTEIAYSKSSMATVKMPLKYYNDDYLRIRREQEYENDEKLWDKYTNGGKEWDETVQIYFVEDAMYQNYLEQYHYNVSEYMDTEHPKALVWSRVIVSNREGKIFASQILQEQNFSCQVKFEDWDEDGNTVGQYPLDLTMGEISEDTMPLGVEDSGGITLVLPYRILEEREIVQQLPARFDQTLFMLRSSDHWTTTAKLTEYVKQNKYYEHYETEHIYDLREAQEAAHASVTIIEIFSYGFIVLITLISLANVFNTISTNIALRRQEFAMLKSVGMTKRGFHHMMNYECLLFGFKGLLYGLPVSFGINYLMYRVMNEGLYGRFLVPWGSLGISVVSVFLVVFLTMFYSYHKMAQDNPIEALRNENI